MFRILPSGHVEKARRLHRIFQISLQIPSATRACLSCARADTTIVKLLSICIVNPVRPPRRNLSRESRRACSYWCTYVTKPEVTRIPKHKLQRLLWGWNQSAKAQTCRQTVETDSPYLAFHTTIHANRRESGMRHPGGDKAVKCRLPHQNVACAR